MGQVGFNHIDTANDYNNQKGVGAALAGVDRSSYFLTTKVPPGNAKKTAKNLQENGVSLSTKTTKQSHMEQDLDMFNFELTADEKSQLDSATSPADKPSFTCSKFEATVV